MAGAPPSAPGGGLRLLAGLDARRAAALVGHAGWPARLVVALPVLALAALLWTGGADALGAAPAGERAGAASMLLSALLSFLAHGVLFGATDTRLLRRLGLPSRALWAERSLRLLGVGLLAALALVPAFAGGPEALPRVAAAALAAVLAAWGAALLANAAAARAMSGRAGRGRGWGLLSAGMWDQELATVAPLVWTPLPTLLLGFGAGAWVGRGAEGAGLRLALVALGAALAAWASLRPAAGALPRFLPQTFEMTYAPTSAQGDTRLVVGRGLARLVPRRAAAVWARDAAVGERRFAWASRLVWPVALAGFFGLARWGDAPGARLWVGAAVLWVLAAQAAALALLGREERRAPGWIDRALGLGPGDRLLGRWLWGLGLGVWLTVPVALAWQWWTPVGGGGAWIAAGGLTALLGAAGSLLLARGRRA